MKTFFLVFALTIFVGNGQGNIIKASYYDFKPELTDETFSLDLENGSCIDININYFTKTIHYSTVGFESEDKFAGHVNINIWTGPNHCPDQSVYSVYNAPTTGIIYGHDLNPVFCNVAGPDLTLWIKYNRGNGTYCSEYAYFTW